MAMRLPCLLLSCTILLGGCRTAAPSSGDPAAVLATVQAFFAAMANRDADAAARVVLADGVFVNSRVVDGQRREQSFTNRDFVARLPRETHALREAFTATPTVLVSGDVAVVFGDYAFELDGKPSHQGVDVITLLRTDAGWRIAGGAYTVVAATADKQ